MTAHARSAWGALSAAFLVIIGLTIAATARGSGAMKIPDSRIEPILWTEVEGWAEDDHAAAFATFLKSCKAVVAGERSNRDPRPMFGALREVCARAIKAGSLDGAGAREFFEKNFRPVVISKLGESAGFLTGYYEPVVEGSRVPHGDYTVPMHRRPSNLVAAGQRKASTAFPNKGKVGRRVGRRKIAAYFDRAQIEDGALDGRHLEICWLKDPIEAFFIHIQGSARIRLEDGAVMRINYDSHNGHPYTPVGRILIERDIVPKDEMSMDRIRQWMEANPEEGRALRRKNKSYVFFRITNLTEDDEAVGAQGVQLTPGRSLAVDRRLHVYGTPFFIDAELPLDGVDSKNKYRRLLFAQDTGSAIVGPARGDIYFGAGKEAGSVSGRLRHPGRFVMLVPNALDPVVTSSKVPLPPLRGMRPTAKEKDLVAAKKSRGKHAKATKPVAAKKAVKPQNTAKPTKPAKGAKPKPKAKR
jgi:membrane-bound lytic murein transglycosylase A